MKCPDCGHEIPTGKSTCPGCQRPPEAREPEGDARHGGEALPDLRRPGECEKCGWINPKGETTCRRCRAKLEQTRLVPGRLYRKPVHCLLCPPHAPLLMEEGGAYLIGRGGDCDLVLFGEHVSRVHCRVQVLDDICRIKDQDSSNGTFINGTCVTRETVLTDGDALVVGGFRISYTRTKPRDLPAHDAQERSARQMAETTPMGDQGPVALRGLLEEVSLPEVLLILHDRSRSGSLAVQSDAGNGLLWLSSGEVVACKCGEGVRGLEALLHLSTGTRGEFLFTTDTWSGVPEIDLEPQTVLERCLERYREATGSSRTD